MELEAALDGRAARRRFAFCQVRAYLAATAASVAIVAVIVLVLGLPPEAPPPPAPLVEVYSAQCSAHPQCNAKGLVGDCCPTATDNAELLDCCSPIESGVKLDPFLGMCYTPAPAKTVFNFPTDDYMAPWSEPLWGPDGRDDLGRIRKLNVSLIRMYGNDPRLDHTRFLDRASELDLGVLVALSDFPYTQDPKKKCAVAPPYDCFDEISEQYTQMLLNGFTVLTSAGRRTYHPAIKGIIILNEPELKVTWTDGTINTVTRSQGYYTTAIVSAMDGAIDAERRLQVGVGADGRMPPFTVTFSFDACMACQSNKRGHTAGGTPVGQFNALAFMYDFVLASLAPQTYGYKSAQNDLRAALQNRFVLGFNTQDGADAICAGLLNPLAKTPLRHLPVLVGEYKASQQSKDTSPTSTFEADLRKMRQFVDGPACSGDKPLAGVSIFEFQVSYWKGPADQQMDFGIYQLGDRRLGKTVKAEETKWEDYDVWCLRQKRNSMGSSWVEPVASVLGGTVPDDAGC